MTNNNKADFFAFDSENDLMNQDSIAFLNPDRTNDLCNPYPPFNPPNKFKKREYVARFNVGGNFCGHDPDAHRATLSRPAKTGKGGIPVILNTLIERLSQYYYSPGVLPSLNSANDSDRQQRSERREACMLVLRSLLKNLDLASLRVGQPTKEGFVNRQLVVVKNDTGMTMVRVERAIRDLKAAQIISVTQPRQYDTRTDKWRGLAAVKTISKELFAIFGLKVALQFEQKKAVKRLKERAKKWNEKDGKKRTISDLSRFKLVSRKVTAPFQPSKSNKTTSYKAQTEDYERKRSKILVELWKDNPGWTKEQYYQEAEIRLQA